MNLKELAGTITAVAAATAVVGGVVYSTGWVVSRGVAKADAQELMQQNSLEMQKKYDLQLLQLDIRSLTTQISLMESKPERNDWDNEQIRLLKIQLDAKVEILVALTSPKAAQ